MPLLSAIRLVRTFGRKSVVNGLSIVVEPGEVVGLLGPNGAGKSTAFHMIIGRLKPTEGQVWFEDRDITAQPMYRRCRLGMAYLPQEPSVFEDLSVADNLLAILEFHESDRRRRRERLDELLGRLGLAEHAGKKAGKLSGGLRRRLEITRALVTRPKLMMLDEPFAGVDPLVVEDIQGIIRLLRAEGLGVLITDHNVPATLRITDRAYIIQHGDVLVSGTAEEIAGSEVARREYLGQSFTLHAS